MKKKSKESKVGRPTTYKSEYCQRIIDFFSPPYYIIKDITITKPDGTQIDKTEMEALPPKFLNTFAKELAKEIYPRDIKKQASFFVRTNDTFQEWADKNPDFSYALKKAKELETEMYRTNGAMNLYNPAFTIFTLKNIAGWRDNYGVEHSGEVKGGTTTINIIKTYPPKEKIENRIEEKIADTGNPN